MTADSRGCRRVGARAYDRTLTYRLSDPYRPRSLTVLPGTLGFFSFIPSSAGEFGQSRAWQLAHRDCTRSRLSGRRRTACASFSFGFMTGSLMRRMENPSNPRPCVIVRGSDGQTAVANARGRSAASQGRHSPTLPCCILMSGVSNTSCVSICDGLSASIA
jgi:hypothetical protein